MFKQCIGMFSLAFALMLNQAVFAGSAVCGHNMKQMVDSLKLDDAQKEKVKPIFEQFKASMKDKGKEMRDLDTQMNEQLDSGKMNQATLDGLADKKAKLIGDMIKAKMAARVQIATILNDKQKAELKEMIKGQEAKIDAQYKSCHEQN